MRLFATTAKGVEPVLAKEISSIGGHDIAEETGGVRFSGDMALIYRANLWLRTANRVLMPIASFRCPSEEHLYEGVRKIDWKAHLTPSMTLAIDANVRDSAITHSKYAALKAKDAVVDNMRARFGSRPNVDVSDPDVRINLHIARDTCDLSLDTSGSSLHKRGYRVGLVEAPLKETLAAAIVDLTEWDCAVPFVDPMCGSGTILIEAALKAARIAPGSLGRKFGFERWLGFDRKLWKSLLEEAAGRRVKKPSVSIEGYDRAQKAIDAARANASKATVERIVSFDRTPISNLGARTGPGAVVLNPPYGERLGDKKELESLYKEIGDVFKHTFKGYTGYVFTGNLDLAKRIGLRASKRIVLYNGPIESRLLKFELY
ncbi:MAG: THUMP domain-containing class I SAM-dependent RNA methyltransferase [Candidatus Aquicultorales bacterium]